MRNLLLKISYDGKYYHGWQIQKNAVTVQEVFQDALKNILGIQPDLKGCSRTDSGVHAYEYCISMKLEHSIPEQRLVAALNHFLPPNIAVHSCEQVDDDFTQDTPAKEKNMSIRCGIIPSETLFWMVMPIIIGMLWMKNSCMKLQNIILAPMILHPFVRWTNAKWAIWYEL